MADSPLKKKTTRSLVWSFADKFGQQILNFVSMLVLMNIIAPEAYGLVGSLSVFTAFSTILIDSGFGRALLNQKEVLDSDYSSVFYFNIGLSICLYLVLFFFSPYLAIIFDAPSLTFISRVMFLALIFNGIGSIHYTILIKRADYKGITKMNLLALFFVTIISIAMAVLGYGVWALVIQTVAFAFLRTVFLWFQSAWIPIPVFLLSRLKYYFKFSNKILLASIISSAVNNLYPSLIAAFYPMRQVAYFNQAKKYQEIPFLTISNTFRSVSMLILSELNDQTDRLKRVLQKMIKSSAFLSFPIAFVMILIAEPLFYLFFKEKWIEAVPYFQLLVLAGMLSPFIFIFNELFIAKERANFFLALEVLKGVILVMLIVFFFSKGIVGLALSWIIYMMITLMLSIFFAKKVIHYTFLDFFKDTFPYFFIGAVSCLAAYGIVWYIEYDVLFIIVSVVASITFYILLCKLFKLEMTKEIEGWIYSGKKTRR